MTAIIYPVLLFVLNVYLCRELFFLDYSQNMGSIEAAFISISRYLMENWNDLSWFNLWYGGIPYQNTYPPLLHAIVAAAAWLLRISPAHAHHLVTALFYSFAPVSLYWLAARLMNSNAAGFGVGLLYSLVAPSGFLIENVWGDLGTHLGPRRLQTLMKYGEGPHLTALALLPLAIVALDIAVGRRKPLYYVLAAASMAAVVLSNWLGAFALGLAVIAWLLICPARVRTWVTVCAIAILAYLLACPWIPPSTIRAIQFNARAIGGDYTGVYHLLPLRLLCGAAILALMRLILHRWRAPAGFQFACYYSFLTASITLSAEWARIAIVPQPERYHIEMDIALVFLVVSGLTFAISGAVYSISPWIKAGTALLLFCGCYSQVHRIRHAAREWIQPIDILTTPEYHIAKWFDHNAGGSRVMAPGNASYWLNTFTDTPQLGGGFDQGVTNFQDTVAQYIVCSGENAGDRDVEISLLWLRAFGVQFVAVTQPSVAFRKPGKFEDVLPIAWREGNDRIYRVPRRTDSPAHVVHFADLVSRAPIHGLDVEQIRRYVAALENPETSKAKLRWTTRHSAEITASMQPDEIVSVQETFHPGWHATVNGSARRMFADRLGLMAIEPKCDGACAIELTYDGGAEMRVAKWLSALSLLAALIYPALRGKRAPRFTT